MAKQLATSRFDLKRRRGTGIRCQAILSVGTGLAFAAGAQTAAQDAPAKQGTQEVGALQTITVSGQRSDGYTVTDTGSATKLKLTPRETPQSLTIMTRERLDDQGLTSLREVLDSTPGIYSNAYDSERVLFYSRGFLVDTLMYDGVPALTNFNTGSIDETLDTALYERIEIVRGATGLMTGAGNPAASVNLVRKHADAKAPEFSADFSLGSWRNRRAELDLSAPIASDGSIRARGVAVVEDGDSYQALYHKRKYVLYGIVDADLTLATRVSLGFDYQDNRPRSNTWGSFPLFLADGTLADWPRSVTTATDWTFWNRKTQTAFAELRHTFDNGWALRSTLSHREYKEDLALFYVYGFPDPETGTGLEPFAYRSKGKITDNALDLYASGPIEWMGRRHELVLGYNGSRAKNVGTEQEPLALAPTGNFFEWDGSYPEPEFGPSTPSTNIDTDQDALYAAARLSLSDSVKLISGARYARWKVDSFYVYDTPTDSRYSFSKLIPYAGVVWDFHREFSAFGSYTGIFKPQNSRDINGHYLDPIDGSSLELGIKGEHFGGRLNTALTVFETRQNNVAAPVLDPDTGEPVLLPDGSAVSQGIDGTRTRGFEIEVSGQFGEGWQGSLGWTRNITRDGDGQSIRTFIPATLVRLFVTWEPRQLGPLKLGGGVDWQSASNTIVGTPDGATVLRQGSFAQVSLMARYQVNRNMSLQLNANNLLDQKYYVLDQYDNTYYGAPANYTLAFKASY